MESLEKRFNELRLECVERRSIMEALQGQMKETRSDIKELKTAVYGNGREGMKSDLVELKARINLLVAIGTALVVAIVIKTVLEVLH